MAWANDKTFYVTTTVIVERVYTVRATSEAEAKKLALAGKYHELEQCDQGDEEVLDVTLDE